MKVNWSVKLYFFLSSSVAFFLGHISLRNFHLLLLCFLNPTTQTILSPSYLFHYRIMVICYPPIRITSLAPTPIVYYQKMLRVVFGLRAGQSVGLCSPKMPSPGVHQNRSNHFVFLFPPDVVIALFMFLLPPASVLHPSCTPDAVPWHCAPPQAPTAPGAGPTVPCVETAMSRQLLVCVPSTPSIKQETRMTLSLEPNKLFGSSHPKN
jgi:hypothetical protein